MHPCCYDTYGTKSNPQYISPANAVRMIWFSWLTSSHQRSMNSHLHVHRSSGKLRDGITSFAQARWKEQGDLAYMRGQVDWNKAWPKKKRGQEIVLPSSALPDEEIRSINRPVQPLRQWLSFSMFPAGERYLHLWKITVHLWPCGQAGYKPNSCRPGPWWVAHHPIPVILSGNGITFQGSILYYR